MEKDRNLRYQGAASMRTDLQRVKRDASRSGGRSSMPAASVPAAPVGSAAGTYARSHKKIGAWIAAAAVVGVLAAGTMLYLGRQPTAPEPKASAPAAETGKTAIAVLPFANLSPDKDQEYFSDGLTEELLNVLAKN